MGGMIYKKKSVRSEKLEIFLTLPLGLCRKHAKRLESVLLSRRLRKMEFLTPYDAAKIITAEWGGLLSVTLLLRTCAFEGAVLSGMQT